MSYTTPDISYKGTVSGVVTTAGANQEIDMEDGASNPVTVGALAISCTEAMGVKINDETNIHQFAAGDKFNFEGVAITKIVIVESGVTIDYKGLFV